MDDLQWHYAIAGGQQGPVSFLRLQELASCGQLVRTNLVWQTGTAQWVIAGTVAGLFAENGPPPLPVGQVPMGYYNPSQYAPAEDIGQNAGMRMLLPVGRSGWAIAAGYLGLLSVLMVPGPLALAFGLLAISDIKRHPERHGMGRAIFGIVMGALGTGVLIFLIVAYLLK